MAPNYDHRSHPAVNKMWQQIARTRCRLTDLQRRQSVHSRLMLPTLFIILGCWACRSCRISIWESQTHLQESSWHIPPGDLRLSIVIRLIVRPFDDCSAPKKGKHGSILQHIVPLQDCYASAEWKVTRCQIGKYLKPNSCLTQQSCKLLQQNDCLWAVLHASMAASCSFQVWPVWRYETKSSSQLFVDAVVCPHSLQ